MYYTLYKEKKYESSKLIMNTQGIIANLARQKIMLITTIGILESMWAHNCVFTAQGVFLISGDG